MITKTAYRKGKFKLGEVLKNDRWKKLIKVLPRLENGKGVDLGGKKEITKFLEKIVGIPIVPINLRKTEIGSQGIIANLEEPLPLPSNSYDFVFCGEIIEHLRKTDMFLFEMNRIMKFGAIGVMTTPNLASLFNRILLLFGKLPSGYHVSDWFIVDTPFVKNKINPFRGLGHVRLFTLNSLKKLLELYGFEILRIEGYMTGSKKFILIRGFFKFLPPSLSEGILIKFRKVRKPMISKKLIKSFIE